MRIQSDELRKQRWKNLALDAAGEGFVITDSQGRIEYSNRAFIEITGYQMSMILGKNCSMFASGHTSRETYSELWNSLQTHGQWHGELLNRRRNGEIFTQMTTISAVYDEEDTAEQRKPQGYIAVMRDISLRKELEQELETLATQDGLTGTLNRKTVMQQACQKLRWARRYQDEFSVIILDIDHFKAINDRWGHPMGDKAIKAVSDCCASLIGENHLLGRIGGEEFLLILPDTSESQAFGYASRLRELIAATVFGTTEDDELRLTCSFGVSALIHSGDARHTDDELALSELIARADTALYEAKRQGRNCVRNASECFSETNKM